MRTKLQVAVLSTIVLVLGGCGVQGKWAMQSIEPDSARGKFNLANVELRRDGTYSAESKYDGKSMTSSGRYEFANNRLTFIPEKGEKRTYDAELCGMCNELKVSGHEHGQTWHAMMKRQ